MTKQEITMNALNGMFLKSDGTINEEWLCDNISIILFNTRELTYDVTCNNRRSCESIVWETFIQVANTAIENERGDRKYTCTSKQLKKWLNECGHGYDTLKPVVQEAKEYREEYRKNIEKEVKKNKFVTEEVSVTGL